MLNFILVSSIFINSIAMEAEGEETVLAGDLSFEHCGIASIYGLLKCNGVTATLEDVEARVEKLHPHAIFSQLSMAELRSTLESFGLDAKSFVSNRKPRQVPVPSIIYLRPDKVGGGEVGHVVLLRSISSHSAVISDFTAGIGTQEVSIDELRSFWDGEIIAVEPVRQGREAILRIAGLGLLAFLIWYFAASIVRMRLRKEPGLVE